MRRFLNSVAYAISTPKIDYLEATDASPLVKPGQHQPPVSDHRRDVCLSIHKRCCLAQSWTYLFNIKNSIIKNNVVGSPGHDFANL